MKSNLTLFLALLALSVPCAYAQGDKTGGGGDVLVCLEDGKTKNYLLDVYEAKLNNQFLKLGASTLSIRDKILLVKERYTDLDPVRAERYASEALKMIDDIEAQENHHEAPNGLVLLRAKELKDIDDANEKFTFSEDCKKHQLVIQETPATPHAPTYTIDQTYWGSPNFDTDQKVATLYHEVIYREFRAQGAHTSKVVRVLNADLLSGKISKWKSGEYRDFIRDQNLGGYRLGGEFETTASDVTIDKQSGEIIGIHDKFEKNLGGMKVILAGPEFNSIHQWMSSPVTTTFDFNADQTAIVPHPPGETLGTLSAGVLEPISLVSHTYRFKNLKKSYDGGFLQLEIDGTGKILSRTENGFYQGKQSREMLKALTKLIECSKDLVQVKKDKPQAGFYLESARPLIPKQNAEAIEALANSCSQSKEVPTSLALSPEVSQMLEEFEKPKAIECSGSAFTVIAEAFAGLKLGFASMTCLFSDGTRRAYFGPQVGILMVGLGAAVLTGKFTIKGDMSDIGRGGAYVTDLADGVGVMGLQIPKSWKKQNSYQDQYGDSGRDIDESNEFGVGFVGTAGMIEALPMIAAFKKHSDYTHLIQELSQRILTELSH